MADRNHGSRAEFLEDDPFAELARIMGHDPRGANAAPASPVAADPATAPEDDDFNIDLEMELIGELDFAEFDEPVAAPTSSWPREAANSDVAAAPAWDDRFTSEPEQEASAGPVEAEADTSTDFSWEDDFSDTLERELAPAVENFEAPAEAPAMETYEPAAVEAAALEPAHAALSEPVFDEDDMSALEAELRFELSDVVTPATPEFSFSPATATSEAEAIAWEPEAFDADEVQASTVEPVVPEPADLYFSQSYAGQPEEPQWEAPAPAPVEQPATLSLEDELTALLSDTSPAPRSYVAPVETAPSASWQPAVNTFGMTTPSANAVESSLEPTPRPPLAWEPSYEAPQQPSAEVTRYAETISSSTAKDEFHDLFGDGFDLQMELEQQPEISQPVMMATAATAVAAGATAVASSWSRSPESRVAAPEVETVDVAEAAPRLVDDLDIPDVDYGAPAPTARIYDELDGDFAQTFDEPALAEASAAHPAPLHTSASDAAAEEAKWLSEPKYSDDDFAYETELEEAIAMSAYEPEQPEPAQRNRGLMIAAVVAGVAVIGAAGVFGVSLFGGSSDGPALVRADPDPIKVRPENPGGVTVPNQDSQVYQRVAGGSSEVAPGQERLISTAEEPVDVTAQAEPLAPGINDEGSDDVFAGDPVGENDDVAAIMEAAKSEERIPPTEQSAGGALPDDVAAVAPRRVRTMIVRPDGTLVPREDPAPVASVPATAPAPVAEAPTTAPNVLQAPGLPTGTAMGGLAPSATTDEGGPVVVTPPTVSVVPTRRAEPQQQQVAQAPVRQQPIAQPQAPAATPVSAPAAAAPVVAAEAGGAWSMQIASQPTAEGAQTAYQDLARRYSSVLEGRGVNIVRANIDGMGTYYRVRIPASNREEAIQLCTRFKAAGGSCFVSR